MKGLCALQSAFWAGGLRLHHTDKYWPQQAMNPRRPALAAFAQTMYSPVPEFGDHLQSS